jgi:acyl-CoA dehydrogenase
MVHPYLSAEHELFRDALRGFLEQEALPQYSAWEDAGRVPREFWRKMGNQGYLCPTVPEAYGGAGVDFSFAVVVLEELERIGSGLSGMGLHSEIVMPYLLDYAASEQKDRWLPSCVDGTTISAIAMTEPGAGSDLAGIETSASRDGADYILNGQKTFITNGVQAGLVIVVCKTDPNAVPAHAGMSLIVVEAGTPGFDKGPALKKIGQHAQDTGTLYFDHCRVPHENLLGEEGHGFVYLSEKLQQERLIVALSAQIAMEESLALTIRYVKERRAFGQAISKFQNTRFKIAEMATEIVISRNFVDQLIVRHMDGQNIVTEVSMAKWWSTDLAHRVIGECLQLHGGYGYMEENPIARRYRDVAVLPIYAGTNEIMKTIIAKNLDL